MPTCSQTVHHFATRRQILDWRDRHMMKAEYHLQREISTLMESIGCKYETVSLSQLLFSSNEFVKTEIEPLFRDWVEREAGFLLTSARTEIEGILQESRDFALQAGDISCPEPESTVMDAALTATSLVAGVGALPATALLSVSSAGGLLGILGLTTISWPVAVAGLGVSAALLAFGSSRASSLADQARQKQVKQIGEYARERILCAPGNTDTICWKLQELIRNTASRVLQELN